MLSVVSWKRCNLLEAILWHGGEAEAERQRREAGHRLCPDIGGAPFVGVGVHRVFHLEKRRRLARAAQIVDDQINALFIVGAYERLAYLFDV